MTETLPRGGPSHAPPLNAKKPPTAVDRALDDPQVATPAPQRGFSFYRGLDSSNRFKPCTPVRILRLTKSLKRGHSNLSAGRSSNSVDMTSRVPSPIDSSVPRWESDRKGRPSIVSA